jgi:uracil phosphoribosyltransferase
VDCQYQQLNYRTSEVEHLYGAQVHIIKNPWAQTLLAQLCNEKSLAPILFLQIRRLYQLLSQEAMGLFFPKENISMTTRMSVHTDRGIFKGEVLAHESPAVVVSIARAGIVPAQTLMEELSLIINPLQVRQDHLYMARKTDANGHVIGVDMSGSKIGGPQENAVVFIPDPMGATGGSLCQAIDHYKKSVPGKALHYVAMHLIVTPEYIKTVTKRHPDVKILALRLDRGLSDPKVLSSKPGVMMSEERGLNEHDYIVPGAGGVGEILNNSYV